MIETKNLDFLIPLALPPFSGLGRELESKCRKAVHEFGLIEEGDKKIGIALSGGKDSLTLLFLLNALSGRGFPPFEIIAFHVGGEFSCGAAISTGFVQKICNELKVKLVVMNSDIPLEKLSCYPCSRMRRSAIFQAAKNEGIEKIAFGHHQDDSIETLLMNLLQKGEFAGNLAKVPMIDYGITIIRPLILLGEEEIKLFSKQHGYARITCQCPVGQKSKRKDVKGLVTEMEKIFPHARKNLAHAILQYGSSKALRTQDDL